MPQELPLEPDLIKVLAADTRREILGQLQDRRMTVTELSEELELGKATVHEHLNKLTEADLVQRDEDDRLWVYYELTGRGKRLLNPQRTRFYLALASALVAALVAGLAVYAFMMTGGAGFAGEEASQRATQPMLVPTQEEIYADGAIEVPAEGTGGENVRAYLVDEGSAERIRQGDYDVQGLPLRAYTPTTAQTGDVQARDETTLLRSDASLEPGTYYLYVRSGEDDNAQAMPSIRLLDLQASPDRSTWYQKLDEGPLTMTVTREGQPLSAAQLRLSGPHGASPSVPVDSGEARLPAEVLDRLEPGSYELAVQPEDRARWIATDARVDVQPTPLATLPLHVDETHPQPIRLYLEGPARLQDNEVSVGGAEANLSATRDGWTVQLEDPQPGEVLLQLARTSTTVQVHPTLAVDARVHDGPEIHWRLTGEGQPLEEAALYVDGRARGFTDANGTLVTDMLDEGPHRLTVHRADGESITRALTVDGWRLSQAGPSLGVEPVDIASTQASARITVEVTNDARVDQPVTLVAELDGTPLATHGLTLPATSTATAEMTVPVDLGRQQVTVSAHPLEPGPFTYTNETTTDGGNETSSDDGGSGEADAETTDDGDTESGATYDEAPEDSDDDATATIGSRTDDEPDTDGDGIPDGEDACPRAPGPAPEGCPVQEDAADGANAAASPGPLEPVRPDSAAADAEHASEQTPFPGPLALLVVLGLALAIVHARKP